MWQHVGGVAVYSRHVEWQSDCPQHVAFLLGTTGRETPARYAISRFSYRQNNCEAVGAVGQESHPARHVRPGLVGAPTPPLGALRRVGASPCANRLAIPRAATPDTMNSLIAPAMARRIELWPTDRLVPYAKNARTHSPEQVAQIAASIAEFGFNAPILVDSNAGIIAGHGRLLAARKLGLPEVPVVVLDHLTDTQRRAYIIADNKLTENAGWNEEILAAELADLEIEGLDLRLVGFSDDELEALLANDDD